MSDGEPLPLAHSWPAGRAIPDAEVILARCAACGATWRVHQSLAGFRLRCSCDAWVEVPLPPPAPASQELPMPTTDRVPARLDTRTRDENGLVLLPGDPGEMLFAPVRTDLPLAPGALLRASPTNQARWTNRTLLEFGAMLAALLGPQIAAFVFAKGREFELLLPFASLCSGILVAIVVAIAGPPGVLGFRRAAARYCAEALLVAGAGVMAALGWLALLRHAFPDLPDGMRDLVGELGLPLALLVIAVSPAVLEEVIFRGLLQGRLLALLGLRNGMVATAAAFALCHGQPLVLPIHVGIGLYLGWLRLRSQSLWPCMLAHFAYNGSLVGLEFL